jgi:putative ABC transport system permease protein
MQTLWQDFRYAMRTLRGSPGFALIALFTLALGIGATTAIFSAVNAVLLRPLPYRDSGRLVLIWNRMVSTNFPHAPVAAPDVVDFRTQATSFEAIAVSNNVPEVALTGDGDPEQIRMAGVSGNFFSTLGVAPFIGRDFTAEDDPGITPGPPQPGAAPLPPPATILSYELWQRRFGGDIGIIDKTITIDDRPQVVVGVMPRGFRVLMPATAAMPTAIDAWTPLRIDLARLPRDNQWLRVVGRLKPDVTIARAQEEMNRIADRQREQFQYHRNMGMHIDLFPMQADIVNHVRPTLLALLGTVVFVLLIACANVANLLLARASSRRREMAIRAALGAGPARILRQMLTEGLVLAIGGGLAGLVLARVGIEALVALKPADLPRADGIAIDGTVLAFTLVVSLLAALTFAAGPALAVIAPVTDLLNDRTTGRRRSGFGGAFVVVEVALSLVLLIGAGLMIRSFQQLARVEPGFRSHHVLTLNLALPFPRYPQPEARSRFFEQVETRIQALPGVEHVGGVFPMPLGGRLWTGPFGRATDPPDAWTKNEANFRTITPGYFAAMGTRQLQGRSFTPAENRENSEVVVIDRRLADRLWPGANPVGELLGIDLFGTRTMRRVIGVVEHIRHETLAADSRETIYIPHRAFPFPPLTLAVKTTVDPSTLTEAIVREVHAIDPKLAVYGIRTLDTYVERSLAPTRFAMTLMGAFAIVAVILAAIGLYGVLSYMVGQRTHEIGVRIALGAARLSVLEMIVGRGVGLAALGIGIGAIAAVGLTKAIADLLYGVSPTDPVTFAAVAAFLFAVVLLACLVPAYKATRVDPLVSMRVE